MNEQKFPKIEVETLSGKDLVLPNDAEGEMVLIGVAFVREAQSMLDSWMEYFEELCQEQEVYELPMIESNFWKIFSGFIDRGMKSGIRDEKHDFVGTHYGDASEFKKKLDIKDTDLGYVYLLDEEGHIKFRGKGFADEKGKEEMLKHVKHVCQLLPPKGGSLPVNSISDLKR